MKHFFDIQIATEIGINPAIVLENISYWVTENTVNNRNLFNGEYWTYNSKKAYEQMFPYMSLKQINGAFEKLLDAGYIKKGNFNEDKLDRTLWYTLTDLAREKMGWYVQNQQNMPANNVPTHFPSGENAISLRGKCNFPTGEMQFPYRENNHYTDINNTDINIINNITTKSEAKADEKVNYESEFEVLYKKYPRKEGKKQALRHFVHARKTGHTVEEIEHALDNYIAYLKAEKTERRFTKQASTWFNNWEDWVNFEAEPEYADKTKCPRLTDTQIAEQTDKRWTYIA